MSKLLPELSVSSIYHWSFVASCLVSLAFSRDAVDDFNKDDILLAESLADAIALSLDNASLYEETRKRLNEQTTLREAGELISASIDTSNVLRTVAEQMAKAIDATSAYILSYNPVTNRSTLQGSYIGPAGLAPGT